MLASGIWGTTVSLLERAAQGGFGAVTAKSCGPIPRAGHVNPSCLAWGHGLLNAIGLANQVLEVYGGDGICDFGVAHAAYREFFLGDGFEINLSRLHHIRLKPGFDDDESCGWHGAGVCAGG